MRVLNVLPSEQCIKRCTAEDNVDVTDQCEQMVVSLESIIYRLKIAECKFFGCD